MAIDKVSFGTFGRPTYQEESAMVDILRGGVKIGTLTRIVRWDFRSASSRSLVPEVVAYEVDAPRFEGREFTTSESGSAALALSAAKTFARTM